MILIVMCDLEDYSDDDDHDDDDDDVSSLCDCSVDCGRGSSFVMIVVDGDSLGCGRGSNREHAAG